MTGDPSTGQLTQQLQEWSLYGTSHLGVKNTNLSARTLSLSSSLNIPRNMTEDLDRTANDDEFFESDRGFKAFEQFNHLGNVLAVVSDKKLGTDDDLDGRSDTYNAIVLSAQDYFPFGWIQPHRQYSNSDYRYGFNGTEKSPEISNGHQTTFYRETDTRIGRWWSVDPVTFPYQTPYNSMNNNPIQFIDPMGSHIEDPNNEVGVLEAMASNEINLINKKIEKKEQRKIELEQSIVPSLSKKEVKKIEKQISNIEKKILDIEDEKKPYKKFLDEIKIIRESEQHYVINIYNTQALNKGGTINYHFASDKMVINVPSNNIIEVLSHELKHAYQYEKGMIAFDYKSGEGSTIIYDAYDEMYAFRRAALFIKMQGGTPYDGQTLDLEYIVQIPSYANLPREKLSLSDPEKLRELRGKAYNAGKYNHETFPIFKGWKEHYNNGKKKRKE